MKKITIVILVALSLTGCAFLNQQKANWAACKADQACLDSAKAEESQVSSVVTGVASVIPIPVVAATAPIAGKVAGYIALALAMLIGGNALNKKPKQPTG